MQSAHHLSYQICDGFYNTFHSSGKYAQPGRRLSTTDWLKMTKDFANALTNSNRADSRSMFPRTFRRDGKRIFVVKNIPIFILYIVFACNKKKSIYGKGL